MVSVLDHAFLLHFHGWALKMTKCHSIWHHLQMIPCPSNTQGRDDLRKSLRTRWFSRLSLSPKQHRCSKSVRSIACFERNRNVEVSRLIDSKEYNSPFFLHTANQVGLRPNCSFGGTRLVCEDRSLPIFWYYFYVRFGSRGKSYLSCESYRGKQRRSRSEQFS